MVISQFDSFCAVHYVGYVSSQVRIILATGNM